MPEARTGPDDHTLGELTDDDLAALAGGRPEAIGVLYERYVDAIYAFCARRLGSREAAEDAAGLVFLRMVDALPAYRPSGRFRAWLFTIAFRIVADVHRARRPVAPLGDAGDAIADPSPGPERAAVEAETVSAVRAAMRRLPDDQRAIVELRLAGLTGPEIAQVVGRSLPAVKFAQFRAYQRLRGLLETHAEEVSRAGP